MLNGVCRIFWRSKRGVRANPLEPPLPTGLNDILEIIDHREGNRTVYIFDERSGPKNTDHTVSYLTHFMKNCFPMWLKRVHLFLDNACSTNKNAFLMSWAVELVQQGVMDFIRVSFMVVGHTKFEPDRLFSMTAKAYASSDVFSTEELATTMSPYAKPSVDDGKLVDCHTYISPSIHSYLLIQRYLKNTMLQESC